MPMYVFRGTARLDYEEAKALWEAIFASYDAARDFAKKASGAHSGENPNESARVTGPSL